MGARGQGVGQGPAKGASAHTHRPLDTSPEKQKARIAARWGGLKARMRAYSQEHPEKKVTEKAPSRVEIAELARGDMHGALERLVLLMHTSRSDMAVVQAFNSLKDLAYGKDPQAIDMTVDFEGMTDAELRVAIAKELGVKTIEYASGRDDERVAPPPTTAEFD